MGTFQYQDYLRSEAWKERRQAAVRRALGRCQVCNGSERLDVHHRTYARLGRERDEDLVVLCRRCHDLFHGAIAEHGERGLGPEASLSGDLSEGEAEILASSFAGKAPKEVQETAKACGAFWRGIAGRAAERWRHR